MRHQGTFHAALAEEVRLLRQALAHREALLEALENDPTGDHGADGSTDGDGGTNLHIAREAGSPSATESNAGGDAGRLPSAWQSPDVLLMLDHLPHPLVITDESGHHHYANQEAHRWFGPLSFKPLDQLWPEPRRRQLLASNEEREAHVARADGRPVTLEGRPVVVQGHRIWLSTASERTPAEGDPHETSSGVLSSLLRASRSTPPASSSPGTSATAPPSVLGNDLFVQIFESCPSALCLFDVEQVRVEAVNDACCTLLGREREDIIGYSVEDLSLFTDASYAQALHAALASGEAPQVRQFNRGANQGQRIQGWFKRLELPFGSHVLCVMEDITELSEAEQQFREARAEAENASRMKTAFLTNMTHEVKTPLTVILGFTSMLKQGVRDDYQRFIRVIERSGRRLLRVLDSMLDLAHLEAGVMKMAPTHFNVADVVRRVTDAMRPLAREKELDLVELPKEHVYADLDYEILERVLSNLLDNSIKFTEEGHIRMVMEADADSFTLRLTDTGIGIDAEFLPFLFQPFEQESTGLSRTHQGSGLGLTVTRQLIELMGGTIEVESTKGQGSAFVVTLPLKAPPSNGTALPSSAAPPSAGS